MGQDSKLLTERYTQVRESGFYDHELAAIRRADPKTNPYHKCDTCMFSIIASLTPILTKQIDDLRNQGYKDWEIEEVIKRANYKILNNLFHGGKPRLM